MKYATDHKPSYKIVTLGCPVNQAESSAIEEGLCSAGFTKASGTADLCIVNTCAVTQSAARKSRKETRRLRRENPKAKIAFIGCYSQLDPEEVKRLVPEADVIIGTAGRSKILQTISKKGTDLKVEHPLLIEKLHREEAYEEYPLLRNPRRVRPVVKIQEGCSEFCAYCAVVIARGKPRSRDPKIVHREVSHLAAAGYSEIVLAGTHLGLYGTDLKTRMDLADLMEHLRRINHPFRLRLASLEPMGADEKLLKTMASSARICPSLYMPLQSGSTRILEKMSRKYTVSEFCSIVETARHFLPSVSIAVDLIAGFPGEREEDHKKTMETVRELKISHLHVFPFSPRPETAAAAMKDQVRPDVIKHRADELKSLSEELSLNFHQGLVGTDLEVLVEEIRAKGGYYAAEGLSQNYVLTSFPFLEEEITRGAIRTVRAVRAHSWGVEAALPTENF